MHIIGFASLNQHLACMFEGLLCLAQSGRACGVRGQAAARRSEKQKTKTKKPK
jgi:hypothetical protein